MLRDRFMGANYASMPHMQPPEKSLGRGVIVLGMHRSGTSAVTGVLNTLGLPAARAEDRFPTKQWNARGNYESSSVTKFDDQLLQLLGGTWWAPPVLVPGWETDPQLSGALNRATTVFGAAHPAGRWVWKDPRACLLLPFWDQVLGPDMPRIVVLRNPLEIADSLHERNGIPREHAVALTERHLSGCLRGSAGRPVLITSYDELLNRIDRWCRRTAAFVSANGIPIARPLPLDAAKSFLDTTLRHHREPDDLGKTVNKGLRQLWTWAMDRRGVHDALSVKGLPPESKETGALLEGIWIGYHLARTPELNAPRG
jgi:hypothetical protein